MINLLPPESINNIRYGRHNTRLRKWLFGIWVAIAGLIVILAGGWIYIKQQSNNLQANIDNTNQQLTDQNLSQVQKDAKEISGDVKVINQLLNQEIHFSGLIQAIGNAMPPGAILDSLSLSKVSGTLDLTASAKSYTSAAQIAVNLSDPKNDLFSKADIVNISCTPAAGQAYGCGVTLKVLFSKTAQTKFLGVPKDVKS